MENYKNLKEDKEFFPYEYGASRYSQTSESIMKLSIREELASKINLIYTQMEDNVVLFSIPGGSFKRKLIINLSHYMNYNIRQPRRGENLKRRFQMIMGNMIFLMEQVIKENGRMVNIMGKEFFLILQEMISTKGNGRMVKCMVKGFVFIMMVFRRESLRENLRIIVYMD